MRMKRFQYSLRSLLFASTVAASFFAGFQTRRALLEAELSRVRAAAEDALLEKTRNELLLTNAELKVDLLGRENASLRAEVGMVKNRHGK